jgi:hypothetical protein
MVIDITLSNAKVYDISKVDILLGETFTLNTNGDGSEDITSDHDNVLEITELGPNCKCVAKTVGISTIRWMNQADQVIDKVLITVFTPANDLGLTADAPVSK